jgi:hypothetical protein
MSAEKRDVLDVLRYELNFLEQGGYERVDELGLPVSIFQDSLSCLNHGDPVRSHACHECLLYDFVAPEARTEDVPCHFIPLDEQGRTLRDIPGPSEQLLHLKSWLQTTIARIQAERREIAVANDKLVSSSMHPMK